MIFIKGEVLKRPQTEFEKAGYTNGNGMARVKGTDVSHNLLNTEAVTDTFYVKNFWTKPVSFKMEPSEFVTEVSRNFGSELNPGQEGYVVLKYDAAKRHKFGMSKDAIVFNTNDSIEPTKRIHYSVNIKEDFSKLTPNQLKKAPVSEVNVEKVLFGEMQKKATKSETIILKNTGKNPLIIRALESGNSLFKVSSNMMEIRSGSSAEITVTFTAPGRPSTQTTTIEIITNDPANPIRTLPVSVKVL
jgi:uncharacterized cupredoxin-like copper-binding protein